MKNLGKNRSIIILFLLIFALNLEAYVKAKLKDETIISGDEAELWIEASGGSIKFPEIEEIGGFKISNHYTSTSINYTKGKKEKKYIRKYLFHPLKSVDIPSYKVIVGGKTQMTTPLRLEVKRDPIDKNGSFVFKMSANKSALYVNEPLIVEFVFKHKINLPISDASFDLPKFKGFWVKKLRAVPNRTDRKSGYKIYKIRYLLYPQYSGTLHINGGVMDMGMIISKKRRYYSFRSIRRKKIISNSLDINVSELLEGVNLYGDFTFSGVADKTKVKANEPVNFTVTIIGEGNVDDIEEFKIDATGAEVYADKPQRLMQEKDGRVIVIYKQKFAVVSDRNFTIEPLEFKFFDSKTKNIKSIKSKRYDIEVTNPVIMTNSERLIKAKSTTPISKKGINWLFMALIFSVGVLAGVLFSYLFSYIKKIKREEKSVSISQKLSKTKDEKELLSLLLPFMDRSSKIRELIKKLEENIYSNGTNEINRKKIAKEFESLLIDDEVVEILR